MPAPDLPIIGQPFKILGHFSTVMIQCQCQAKTPLMLVGLGGMAKCPGCQKRYAIAEQGNSVVGQVSGVQGGPS